MFFGCAAKQRRRQGLKGGPRLLKMRKNDDNGPSVAGLTGADGARGGKFAGERRHGASIWPCGAYAPLRRPRPARKPPAAATTGADKARNGPKQKAARPVSQRETGRADMQNRPSGSGGKATTQSGGAPTAPKAGRGAHARSWLRGGEMLKTGTFCLHRHAPPQQPPRRSPGHAALRRGHSPPSTSLML